MANEAALKISAALDPANAQIEQLKAKIVSIQDANRSAAAAAREMGSATRAEMREAQHAVHLLGDEIGVKIPRHLRGVIASLPGFASVLSAAFAPAAGFALLEILSNALEKIPALTDELMGFGKAEKDIFEQAKKDNEKQIEHLKEMVKLNREIEYAKADDAKKRELLLEWARKDLDAAREMRDEKQKESVAINQQIIALQKRRALLEAESTSGPQVASGLSRDIQDATKELKKLEEERQKVNSEELKLADIVDELSAKQKKAGAENLASLSAQIEKAKEFVAALNAPGGFVAKARFEMNSDILKEGEKRTQEFAKLFEEDLKAQEKTNSEALKSYHEMAQGMMLDVEARADVVASEFEREKSDIQEIASLGLISERNRIERTREAEKKIYEIKLQALNDRLAILQADPDMNPQKTAEIQKQIQDLWVRHEATLHNLDIAAQKEHLKIVGEIRQNFETAFSSVISGTQSAADAFRSMAQSIIAEIAKIIAKMLVLRAVNAIVGVFGGGKAGTGGAGDLAGMLGPVTGVAGHHASGGFFEAGVPFIAGEEGPEPIFPSTSGRVMPAYSLRGNSQQGTTILIDARGADAGVEQRVMRAAKLFHDQAVVRAVQIVEEKGRRR